MHAIIDLGSNKCYRGTFTTNLQLFYIMGAAIQVIPSKNGDFGTKTEKKENLIVLQLLNMTCCIVV